MIKYKTFVLLAGYETNTYLVWDTESLEAVLIDPAAPNENLVNEINSMGLKLTRIINTHGHGDHIGGNEFFLKAFNVPICIHKDDANMLGNPQLNLSFFMNMNIGSPEAKEAFEDKAAFQLGDNTIKVFHTPGHTKGGIIIYAEPYLFTGDTLFLNDIGRTDLPGGDFKALIKSIKEKIFILPQDTIVLPGHGAASTIKHELTSNPYT